METINRSEVSMKFESIISANLEDTNAFYDNLESLSYEMADDITTIVKSSLDVKEEPSQVLSAYCLKTAFEYAAEEVRGILISAMMSRDIDLIIKSLNESVSHNQCMAEDELKAIIDMIN